MFAPSRVPRVPSHPEPEWAAAQGQPAMKQRLLQQKHPLFVLELERPECRFGSAEQIIDYLKGCIAAHPSARFIAIFDHHAHTQSLPQGRLAPSILAAKNIVFCFGIALSDPAVLGLRPRSIGVAETLGGFVISFLEPPMPIANAAMEHWAEGLYRALA